MNSNNKLNIRTRWGKFISWGMTLDVNLDPFDESTEYNNYLRQKGVRYCRFPESLVLTLEFEKNSIRFVVEYEARNSSDQDVLLIQSKLIKCLQQASRTTKWGGYPKSFMVGEIKFQLRSIATGEAKL